MRGTAEPDDVLARRNGDSCKTLSPGKFSPAVFSSAKPSDRWGDAPRGAGAGECHARLAGVGGFCRGGGSTHRKSHKQGRGAKTASTARGRAIMPRKYRQYCNMAGVPSDIQSGGAGGPVLGLNSNVALRLTLNPSRASPIP